jgi:cell division protein FtsB
MRYWDTPRSGRESAKNRSGGYRRPIASGGNLRAYPFLRTFYQHQAEISDGLQKFLFFLFLATLLYVFVIGDAGAIRILGLTKEKSTLRAEVQSVHVDIDRLQTAIDRLNKDSFIMEKLGRERYGYAAPGDRVIKLVPQKEDE